MVKNVLFLLFLGENPVGRSLNPPKAPVPDSSCEKSDGAAAGSRPAAHLPRERSLRRTHGSVWFYRCRRLSREP